RGRQERHDAALAVVLGDDEWVAELDLLAKLVNAAAQLLVVGLTPEFHQPESFVVGILSALLALLAQERFQLLGQLKKRFITQEHLANGALMALQGRSVFGVAGLSRSLIQVVNNILAFARI